MNASKSVWASSVVVLALLAGCSQGPEGAAGQNGQDGKDGVGLKGDPGVPGPDGGQGEKGEQGEPGPVKPPRLLDCDEPLWRTEVRDAINDMIAKKGIASATWDAKNRPVAVFDWDNTVLKNDIGDATFFWMIQHDKIRRPADWKTTNAALTAAAVKALETTCNGAAAVGEPIPTSTTPACATELAKIYDSGKTNTAVTVDTTDYPVGSAAWTNPVTTTINQQYAWVAQLTAGWSPSEIRSFARAAFEENSNNPIDTPQTIGTATGYTHWVRIYTQMRDLIGTLQANGFDVWVVSASPQYFVDEISEQVGVEANHVVGIRSVLANGKATYDIEDCGGAAKNSLITFDEGKRCWINKVIFKQAEPLKVAPEGRRPVFVAGDSDTDIAMLKDATALKLVINRNKTQLMCNAYQSLDKKDGRWLVQPMFIKPKGEMPGEYGCMTTNIPGTTNKIVDEAGVVFPKNYKDTVFTLGPVSTCP